jgi:hypothetical protein
MELDMCFTYSTAGDHEVIVFGHPSRRLDDLFFIIRYDFNTLQVDAKRETVFGEPGRVRINGLGRASASADL